MREPAIRIHTDELIIDSFAGGGGASLGIEWATGRSPDVAINHDPEAIAMHAANHPSTRHYCESVWDVEPKEATKGRRVALAWFSPDCKHFSKAKNGKPVDKEIRGLAWIVIKWAKAVQPRVIILENVEEFQDWGPLTDDGKPCPLRRGFTFRRWLKQLENAGYKVDMRELRACDYGAPTIRKRLFIIARADGLPIVWPEPTHTPAQYRTAAECISWELPCPSIFTRERPLAENTLRRISRGIWRYVINSADPFIVSLTHNGSDRIEGINEPFRTITGAHRGEKALVTPYLIGAGGPAYAGEPRAADRPYATVMPTTHGALCAALLARHYGGHENDGAPMQLPLFTVTAKDHHALVASHLTKFKGTSPDGQALTDPLHTVQAFLIKYFGQGVGQTVTEPAHTVTARDRFGLVTVHGEDYAIADIGMRMLQPRELFRAQGFPDTWKIDPVVDGKPLTKTAQVRCVGNSVCPPIAAALVRAQFAVEQGTEEVGTI